MAETTECGYWKYLGKNDVPKVSGSMKQIDPDQLDYGHQPLTEYTDSYSTPRILTRCEKGQALTHLEMDFNLASLFHKLNTSSQGAPWTPEENAEDGDTSGVDVYFERHKPTREEEMEGLFATFSYAPVVNSSSTVIQNPFQTIKIQHTTDEIRYKLSNELIPGTLDVQEDFHVTGSIYTSQSVFALGNAKVSGDVSGSTLRVAKSAEIGTQLRVGGTASFEQDVYIVGNLYVNGVMFGNLARQEYHPTVESRDNYTVPYDPQGPVPNQEVPIRSAVASPESSNVENPRYYTQEEVDEMLQNLRAELLAEIHGQTQD